MAQVKLIPSGGLDKDTDLIGLVEGDYSDARNIVIGTGKSGGGDTIRLMESIKVLPITQISGIEKARFLAASGNIYVLFKDGANASIYEIPPSLSTKTLIITYAHSVSSDFVPDLKMLGDTLIWNYHSNGTLLYWNINRTKGSTVQSGDLVHAKSAPINVIGVSRTGSPSTTSDFLELNDFQFSARYKYDTGEYSVLGNYSEMFKGNKGSSSFSISFTLTGKPTYAEEIEVYMRKSSSGTWFRIYTGDITSGTLASITWEGDYYDALSYDESATPFSAIPSSVKNIAIVDNRVVLGDFEDDYPNDATGTLALSVTNGYSIPADGGIENYFGSGTSAASVNSNEVGTYYKPFTNNSSYTIGVAFLDSAMKTRGVEYTKTFSTGLFTYPIAPVVSITQTGDARPSWAKWMQLVITNNLNKSRTFEGFASSIYFEVEVEETDATTGITTTSTKNKLSVYNSDLSKVKSCVLDISGMFSAGRGYAFNAGDRITLSCPSATEGVIDADGSKTGTYRIIDTQVISSLGDKIYIEWNGGECLNDGIPNPSKLYFEIYTPRKVEDNDNLFFYGVGGLIDISSGIPSSIQNYHIGDTVFKTFDMKVYTDQLLYKGYTKSVPAVTSDATTNFVSNKDSGSTNNIALTAVSNSRTPLVATKSVTFTGLGAQNQDEATVASGNPQVKGFYDSRCKATVTFDYDVLRTIGVNLNSGTARYIIKVYLAKVPYDPVLNVYGSEIILGNKKEILFSESYAATLNSTADIFTTKTVEFDFSAVNQVSQITTFDSGDRIKVYFELYVGCSTNDMAGVSLALKEKSGVTTSCTLTLFGSRITPVESYSARSSVATDPSAKTFVVRSMGEGQEWSSGGGKVFTKARDKFSPRRSNAIRHSGNMIYGTAVNNISSFSVLDTVEVPQENGAIMSLQRASRLQGEGDMLLAICQNETSYLLIGEVNSSQSDNSSFSSLSSGVFGSVRNLGEKTGIQDRESVYNHNGDIYWWDNYRNIFVGFSKEGVAILSDMGLKSDFINKSGTAKIAYDPFYMMVLVKVGSSDCVGFSRAKGQWVSYYDIDFDSAIHYGDRVIYSKAGLFYRTLENATGNKYGEFFGTPYSGYIKLTANTVTPIMPLSVSVDHNMNVFDYTRPNWVKSALVDINITNENTQETNIKEVNFSVEDNKLISHVLRDINSVGGIVGGRQMRGGVNNFKLKLKDNTQDCRIFGLNLTFDKVSGH